MRHIWWRRAMVPLVAAGALVGAIMTVGGGSEPATRALAIADATTQSARMPTSDQIGPLRTATDVGIPAKQVTAIKEAVQARTSIPDGSDLYLASENDIAVPGVTDQTLKTYDFAYAPPKADTITNVTTVHVISQSDGSLLVNVRPPVSGLDASANGDGAPTTKTVTTYDLVIDSDSAITSASTSPVAMSAEMQTEGQPITSSDGSSTSSPKLSARALGESRSRRS